MVDCRGVLFVGTTGVGVGVDTGVTGELIRTRESLCASGECTRVRLLSSVCPDVSGLVLETVERLLAQRTLVGSRKLGAVVAHPVKWHSHARHHGGKLRVLVTKVGRSLVVRVCHLVRCR
jgi:hypothetical protein